MAIVIPSAAHAPQTSPISAVTGTKAFDGGKPPAAPQVAPNAPDTKPAKDASLEAFAQKERQLHKMRKELETERQALKAKQVEYETGYIPKSRLTEDPWTVLSDAGLSYDKLTELALNQPNLNDPTTRMLFNKLKAMEDKQAASEKAAVEAQQQQYQQAINTISTDAKQLVDSDPAFELLKAEGAADAVTDYIVRTFEETGKIMDVQEAAEHLEKHLEGHYSKVSQFKKLQPKEAPVSAPKEKQIQPQIKTLTNVVTQQPSKRASERERRERAIAIMEGRIK